MTEDEHDAEPQYISDDKSAPVKLIFKNIR